MGDREEIIRKVDKILEAVEGEPKSLVWKMRSKIGTRKQWYNPVECLETVGGFGIWETLLKNEK